MASYTNKHGLRWKIRLFIVCGFFLLLVLLAGVASLFVIEIEDVIYANGQITSELLYNISGHIDGKVVKLNFDEGSDVRQGDVIIEIDSLRYEEEYQSKRSELAELEAEKEVKKAELAALARNPLPKELWYAETNLEQCIQKAKRMSAKLERFNQLRQISAISTQDLEKAEIDDINAQAELARAKENYRKYKSGLGEKNLEKAQRDIDLVKAKINTCKAAIELATRHMDECRILAPADGRIVELPCKYTMYVEKGETAVKMATGSTVKGIAFVSEGVVRKVKRGQPVRISSGVFSRLEFGSFSGTVDRIRDVPMEQPNGVQTKYAVEITIASHGRHLKLGSSAEFAIVAGREPVIYSMLGLSKEDISIQREQLRRKFSLTKEKDTELLTFNTPAPPQQ
jgi:multidrug resistance efflux pump